MKNQDTSLTGNELLPFPEFENPPACPIQLFEEWLERAENLNVTEPKVFCLATVDQKGRPSTRTVLLKHVDCSGLTFTSHYESRKGQQIKGNPSVAGTFYWKEVLQQINIEGSVQKLDPEQSDRLFSERPFSAQITACVSHQSSVMNDETRLLEQAKSLSETKNQVTRPQTWGGYLLVPNRIEFWYGRKNRLHRRLEYQARANNWIARRLQP